MAFRGFVLSHDPLVVYSSIEGMAAPEPRLGVVSVLPDFFRDKTSLHFLSPSWSVLGSEQHLRAHLQAARTDLPRAHFVVLANDEWELHALRKAGIEAMPGNHTMFVDETTFRPRDTGVEYDAVYNARFSPFKNHRLCADIQSLALIHYTYPGMDSNEEAVRAMLPHARILNRTRRGGTVQMRSAAVAEAVSRSATGLCLSTVEGAMIASVEYLLCGIPVVSVHAQGGRERYFAPPFVELAEADPDSVAAAVERLRERSLPKSSVRHYIMTVLTFERRNFLTALNLKIADLFGPGKEIGLGAPWRQVNTYQSIDEWSSALSQAPANADS